MESLLIINHKSVPSQPFLDLLNISPVQLSIDPGNKYKLYKFTLDGDQQKGIHVIKGV